MAYLSDRCGQERGRVGEEDFFAARDIPRCHDRHSPLSVKVLSRIGHARMVDVAVEVNTLFYIDLIRFSCLTGSTYLMSL